MSEKMDRTVINNFRKLLPIAIVFHIIKFQLFFTNMLLETVAEFKRKLSNVDLSSFLRYNFNT